MRKVPIDGMVPESVKRDLRSVIRRLQEKGGKVRLIRVGYEDFRESIDRLIESQPYIFTPTLLGFPVEPAPGTFCQVIAVRQGDNAVYQDLSGREVDSWQPSSSVR